MAKTFGFDAMLGASVRKRIAKLRAEPGAEAAGDAEQTLSAGVGNQMMMHVVVEELSRVSPGFAMGFGVDGRRRNRRQGHGE